jgi:antitoxin MazE
VIKKLSKYGNSLAVLIDKPILELLNINETTQLRISTDGNNIIIEPVRKERNAPGIVSDDPKKQAIYEEIVEKYNIALKKLAEK